MTKNLRFYSTGHAHGEVYLWMERAWKPTADVLAATLTPTEARRVATRLLRSADLAEGRDE